MVDLDLLIAKAGLVRKHLKRIEDKRPLNFQAFVSDLDLQDIVSFNLQIAIQNCVDIAAHVISELGLGVPGSINEMFYLLEENRYLSPALTDKMVKAIGFGNLFVHEYGKLDLEQVFEISQKDIKDLEEFIKEIFQKFDIT